MEKRWDKVKFHEKLHPSKRKEGVKRKQRTMKNESWTKETDMLLHVCIYKS